MGYVAVKGGTEAVGNAEKLAKYYRLKGQSPIIKVDQIRDQLRLAVDRAMSEGAIYAPDLAALAVKQAEGDPIEASFILRAFRSTRPRDFYSIITDTREIRVIRRISATFKDVPGGQILGPTRDYTVRLLNYELAQETDEKAQRFLEEFLAETPVDQTQETPIFPKIVDLLREQGLLKIDLAPELTKPDVDITRDGLTFPATRAARLQVLARGETGGMVTLAYTTMRGYGDIHPTLGELRVGYLPLKIKHPAGRGEIVIGEVLVTEAEVVSKTFITEAGEKKPLFTVGYGLCFGHNEEKAIAMAVLERAMDTDEPTAPAQDEEFVLSHIDGIEAAGFTAHWKLPHYVTFQSELDRIRRSQAIKEKSKGDQANGD
jgi:alpha-D-ribose 1-methylphosphonate 5-triphosphate synthase subunit PhnI